MDCLGPWGFTKEVIMIREKTNVKLRAMVTTAPPCGCDATVREKWRMAFSASIGYCDTTALLF